MRRHQAVRCVGIGLAVLLLVPALAVAQLIPTKLPTPQGGDFGNGASTSSVAGGAFVDGEEPQATPALAYGIPIGFGAARGHFSALPASSGASGAPATLWMGPCIPDRGSAMRTATAPWR